MNQEARRNVIALACTGLLWNQTALADNACSKRSPSHTVALLELYTSEGCSSCPPADRWLSRIMQSGLNQNQVVPLSLHVDYWDNLGWKDRFASPAFSARQRTLSGWAGFVYTPEVFVGRQEFRQAGEDARLQQNISAINALPAPVSIEITMQPVRNGVLPLQSRIELKNGAAPRKQQLFIAVYENALTSQIAAGENSGAILHHDYVVRRWLGPFQLTTAAQEFRTDIPLDARWKTPSLGIAAFVEDQASGTVLQALASPICGY